MVRMYCVFAAAGASSIPHQSILFSRAPAARGESVLLLGIVFVRRLSSLPDLRQLQLCTSILCNHITSLGITCGWPDVCRLSFFSFFVRESSKAKKG